MAEEAQCIGPAQSKLEKLPKFKRIGVYCDSCYHPSIAASLLQAQGLDVVTARQFAGVGGARLAGAGV